MTLIDKAEALLPCAFCGGVAEQDYQQPYRSISAGKLGKACTIYCTECSANMVLCHEDHPGVSPDDLMAELVAAWNRRAALPARGVGETWHPFDTAPRDGSRFLAQGGGLDAIDICSYNARVGCWDCGSVTLDDTDHEPEGYNRPAQWMPLAVLAPTDAAQAREAVLREAADRVKNAWTPGERLTLGEVLALIGGSK